MANSGIKASQAGTSLRSIFTRMAKPTKEVQAAMDQLGISLTNSDGSMKSLKEIMNDLRSGFAGLTEAQKAQLAASLGGQEAMSGLLAIVNASDEDYQKLTDSIYDADGAAKEMADTMNDNLQGAITLCKSALESVGIALYEEVQEPMKETVKVITGMVEDMNEAMAEKGFDGLIESFGNSLAELAQMAMEAAPTLIGVAENLVGTFINAIMNHQEEFAEVGATVVAELVKAILNVAGDMWSAGIYLFTEFLQALSDHSEEIGRSFGEMLSKIGEAVQENLPLIIQAAKDFVAGFCEGLSEEFPGVSALIEGFLNGFIDTASTIIQGIVDVVSDLFGVIDGADPNVLEAVGYAIGVIAASIAALSVASSVLSSVKSLFKVLGTLKGGVSGLVGVIGKVVEGFALWKGGAGTLMEVLELEFPKVAGIFSSIGGSVQKAIGFFAEFGSSIAGIGSIIAGAILAVTNFVDMFVNGFSFKNNTVTLGDETSAKSYTSSNRQSTAEMEETIKSLPSKTEILQEALRSAQDLINKQVASGYAVHVPNEFIVADDVDYKNKAKNLWRWGLGGFAHYSQGYDGPIDGVALTMDGKINGEMLLVNSVKTESLDAGYRTSVETKISESETAAKNHADNKVRVAREEIENSISNLENKISLSVRSVKETVARKNYIVGGEQETLDKRKFTASGITGSCTIEQAEFLNMNAFKLTFSANGSVTLTQSLGTMEAGNYKIAVEAAYPEGSKYRPSYVRYGFSENQSTEYFSGYSADEFHTYSKQVKITKAAKSVAITVYGYTGSVVYLTNIRCLRDMQELLDDLNARIDVEVGKVSASVSDLYENSLHNYCSNGKFSNNDDKFTGWGRSNTTQVTQTTFDSKSCAKIENTSSTYNISWYQRPWEKRGDITVRFKAACNAEDADTARIRLTIDSKNFYTNAGELSDEWTEFEFTSYATPSYFYTYFYNYVANTTVYITDVEILGYMSAYSESQLTILKDSIESEVKRATAQEGTLSSSIKQNAESITSKVSKGEMGSYITQYYNNVIIAFNKNSKYVQINPGEIAIYNYGVENSKKRAVFDETGNHFYRDGYYVGAIGTNQWSGNNAHKGLVFDLEPQGKYMAFAQKASASATSYTTMLCFSRANSIYDEYGVNLGCNLIGNWYTLKNFKIGSISAGGYTAFSGAIPFVCEITNNGNSWTYSHLRVYNGIIVGYWN